MKTFKEIREETLKEAKKIQDIARKYKRELQKAVKTGQLELSDKATRELERWAVDAGEIRGKEEDEFIDWLDKNLDDLASGKLREGYYSDKDKKQKATLKKHDKRMINISRDSIKKYEKSKKEENDPAIEKQKDGSYSYKRQVIKEEIDVLFEGFMANKVKSVSINKKMYDHALKTLKDVLTRKQKEAKAKKTGMRHSSEYYAAQIARTYKDVDGKVLHKMLGEEHIFEAGGAGDRGTDKLTKRYKKDTPGESVSESIDELFEAQFKVEVEGLPDMFIDAKSAGDVKATLRKKLKKPDDVQSIERVTPDKIKKHFRMVVRGDQDPTSINEDVTQKQLSDLEKFADRLLDKFGVDVEFTRHFADRMNDDRNKPKITIPELQRFFKKVAKNKAKDIKQLGDSEAVLKDIQADLNLPVVINYDKNKEEFEVVNKTIMRKKDFKTPDKVVKY